MKTVELDVKNTGTIKIHHMIIREAHKRVIRVIATYSAAFISYEALFRDVFTTTFSKIVLEMRKEANPVEVFCANKHLRS